MNTFNEFIFIASGIALTFTIVIIGLIVANSKKESKIKTQSEKLTKMDVFFNAKDIEQDKTIKQLNSEVKFKDDLIHGYKHDLKKMVEIEDDKFKMKQAIEHLEKNCEKLQKEVDETTKLNARVARDNQTLRYNNEDLQKANEDWIRKYHRVRYEKAESFKLKILRLEKEIEDLNKSFDRSSESGSMLIEHIIELNQIIDEYSLFILNRAK